MNIYKAVKLFIAVAVASSALLQGMDKKADDAAKRVKKSGYVLSNPRWANAGDDKLNKCFAHTALEDDIYNGVWGDVAMDIVAGCQTDALFADGVTPENMQELCNELDAILISGDANDYDSSRITTFLEKCITTKKITSKDLQHDSLKQLLGQGNTGQTAKNTISKINIYKLAIPIFAVGALAVIAYKWWRSKKAEAKKVENDETDGKEQDEQI